jgi:hypothetical protein
MSRKGLVSLKRRDIYGASTEQSRDIPILRCVCPRITERFTIGRVAAIGTEARSMVGFRW